MSDIHRIHETLQGFKNANIILTFAAHKLSAKVSECERQAMKEGETIYGAIHKRAGHCWRLSDD